MYLMKTYNNKRDIRLQMDIVERVNEIIGYYPIINAINIDGIIIKQLINFNNVYSFIKRLGKGAFGTVNLYRENATGNLYAFKEIRINDSLHTSVNIRYLQDEVEILRRISGDNGSIVKFYDSFVYMKGPIMVYTIVTEYIEGFTLDKYIDDIIARKITVPESIILNIAMWLFSVLAYIHNAGYIHRDIKPENIMVDVAKNRLVLIDFGLTCSVKKKAKSRNIAGTPEFIPPERWNPEKSTIIKSLFRNNSLSILKKSDVWAAGITIFNIVEKRTPWTAKTLPRLCKQIQGPYQIKYKYNVKIITDIIKMAIIRDPHYRLSAQDIVNRIKDLSYEIYNNQESPPYNRFVESDTIVTSYEYEEVFSKSYSVKKFPISEKDSESDDIRNLYKNQNSLISEPDDIILKIHSRNLTISDSSRGRNPTSWRLSKNSKSNYPSTITERSHSRENIPLVTLRTEIINSPQISESPAIEISELTLTNSPRNEKLESHSPRIGVSESPRTESNSPRIGISECPRTESPRIESNSPRIGILESPRTESNSPRNEKLESPRTIAAESLGKKKLLKRVGSNRKFLFGLIKRNK